MSLWGMLSGGDARRWAQDARDSNRNDLNSGYGAMKGYYGQGYDEAKGQMQPYADAGRRGLGVYENMLGNNGADAQKGALASYNQFNPYLAAEQRRIQESLDRRAAATGQFGSGLNALAKAEAVNRSSFQNYTDYMNRQQGLGTMGMQASAGLGNLAMQNAGNLAGTEQWYRGGNISNNTNYFNAQNGAQQGAFNNVLGIAGLGIDAVKAMYGIPPTPKGGPQAPQGTPTPQGGGNNFSMVGTHGYMS